MTLSLYVMRVLGVRILAALLVLVATLQIIDLLDATDAIIARDLGGQGVAYYAMLRLPRMIAQAAPLAVLAGALFGFAKLARDSEVTAMRATGLSTYRLTMMTVPVALLVLGLHLAMTASVAPRTDAELADWWRATEPPRERKAAEPRTFRLGRDIVVATSNDPFGLKLKDLFIYRRDGQGRLIGTIKAASATYQAGAWRLAAPTYQAVSPQAIQTSTAAEMLWKSRLRPADIEALGDGQETPTPTAARAALEGGLSARAPAYYATRLQRLWAEPMACLVMLLLAAPVAMAHFRGRSGAVLMVCCLAGGLVFLVVDGMATALGESGVASAALAAWVAPALFAAMGATTLVYLEG